MTNAAPSTKKAPAATAAKAAPEVATASINDEGLTVVQMPSTEPVRPSPKNPAIEHQLEIVEGTTTLALTDGPVQGSNNPPREPEIVQAEQNGIGMEVVRA